MKRNLLPIGSVVLLKEGKKRLMICGRVQTDAGTKQTYDYSGCLFPEGVIDSQKFYLFNNDSIQQVFFIGLQDVEEMAFRRFLNEKIEKK